MENDVSTYYLKMVIQIKGVSVLIPDASSDGAKEFDIPDGLWDLWSKNKGLCKAHGFFIEKRQDKWIGIYRPFAIFAYGTKRLENEKVRSLV